MNYNKLYRFAISLFIFIQFYLPVKDYSDVLCMTAKYPLKEYLVSGAFYTSLEFHVVT